TAGASFPAGTVHLPSWSDSEWLKQLTAEQLVTVKGKRGFTRLEWGLSRILCFGS
ncbi:terminase gpA endonuclease subunit, partial [Roseibium aquae]|uniref:terminase gpA endonuclease subunit n=1 Tax=Roseibium aquae TaxID=1323746 RepID=UPI00123CBEE3